MFRSPNSRSALEIDAEWFRRRLHRRHSEPVALTAALFPARLLKVLFAFPRCWIASCRLQYRWRSDDGGDAQAAASSPASSGLSDCDIVFINLSHRHDRRQNFESQMGALGIESFQRFEAVRARPGGLGCSMSHEGVLSGWFPRDGALLMVCEDDAIFLASRSELDEIIREFAANSRLSVLALANNTPWRNRISNTLAVSSDIQTTACYVVKASAISGLIRSTQVSIASFHAKRRYAASAIDRVWKRFQGEVFFAVPRRRVVIQMPSHSDIEEAWRNYET